jgi:hypothetical protein
MSSYLSFGIANAYVSSQNDGAKEMCGAAIWYCVVFLGVLHFIEFIVSTAIMCILCLHNKEQPPKKKQSNGYFGMIVLGINTWACVAYFNITTECKAEYIERYDTLWYMLEANVFFFFAMIGIFVWLLVSTGVYVWVKK